MEVGSNPAPPIVRVVGPPAPEWSFERESTRTGAPVATIVNALGAGAESL